MLYDFKYLIILFVRIVLVSATFNIVKQNKEYCQLETFEAKCSRNELILIEEARYGRMSIGKCITQKEITRLGNLGHDLQYFGCYKDVTNILHKKCSLKTECQVGIPNADLDLTNPCFSGMKSYLLAIYTCIDAIESEESCRIIVTQRPKYIASTYSGQCGSIGHPWIVEVSRGQNIKTSISFLNKTERIIDSNMKCDSVIGYVREIDRNAKRNVSICSDGFLVSIDSSRRFQKHRELLSKSSLVEMVLTKSFSEELDFNSMFLIGIEAYGCVDIIPPEDAWLKRNSDDIVIGCYSSKQTWYLRCEDGKWTGSIGNCSVKMHALEPDPLLTTKGYSSEISEEQQIILFVSICAFGVVICLIIVCIGAICIKRYSWKSGATSIYNKQPIYYPNTQYSINHQTLSDNQQKSLNKFENNECFQVNGENGQLMQEKSEENKYFVLEDDMFPK